MHFIVNFMFYTESTGRTRMRYGVCICDGHGSDT